MIENLTTVVNGIVSGITSLFTASTWQGDGTTTVASAAIAVLFAVPVTVGVIRKVTSLIKSSKGN